jgi:hypothetical protein
MSMECSFEVKWTSNTGFGWFLYLTIPGAVHKWWSQLQFKLTKFIVCVSNICIQCKRNIWYHLNVIHYISKLFGGGGGKRELFFTIW